MPTPRRGPDRGAPKRPPGFAGRARGRASSPPAAVHAKAPRGGGSILEEIRAKAPPGKSDRAVRAFEQAVDLLQRDRPGAAVRAARDAKDLASRSGAAREILGLALYHDGQFREALRELQAYRRITGRLDQNHLIADCHRALGAPEKAIEPATQALHARIPDEARAEAAVVGASALADLGRFGEALALLRSFRVRQGATRPFDLRVWYVTGDVLERAGRTREAAEEFRRVLRHDPGAFDAAERLAKLG